MERSSGGAGSCLGLVAIAVVSTTIILISYQLHRRLEADLRVKIGEGRAAAEGDQERRRRRGAAAKKKKVRFADDVVEPSSNNEEYRRRVVASITAAAAAGGGCGGGVTTTPAPHEGEPFRTGPTYSMRRRVCRRLDDPWPEEQRA